jgi:putative ABC transport system permease protein
MDPRSLQQRKANFNPFFGFGGSAITYMRLPPTGLTAAALNAQLPDFAARHIPLERTMSYEFDVTPLRGLLANRRFMSTGIEFGTMLLALGGLVLGVACVNYASLATARATRRAREIGVRKALGAPPRQIMAQALLEAGLLTTLALVLAVILFFLARPVVRDLLDVDLAPTFLDDVRVWPFFAALAVGVTLAAGFYPAFVLSRVQPAAAIASSHVRLGSRFFSLLLVGSQFAIASFLVLVVTIVSMQNAELARSGFGATEDPLVIVENPSRVTKVEAATLLGELERIPQVRGVTEVAGVPWEMTISTSITASPDPGAAVRNVMTRPVGEGFFAVFKVPLVAGRLLGSEHAGDLPPPPPPAPPAGQEPSQPAAPPPRAPDSNIVVDRTFAKAFGFASPEAAVGQTVYRPATPISGLKEPAAMHIVGVVEDRSFTFFDFNQMAGNGAFYTLRPNTEVAIARVARDDLTAGLAAIDAMWKALAPNVAVTRRFLDDAFNNSYEYYVRIGKLFGVLALLAFVISIAGLFAMATLVAARRRQEVGVRKALGARTRQIVVLLLSGFGKPVVIANLVAWPAAFVAARIYLKPFLNPIPLTPLPFLGSLVLMLAIACLAVGTQTWRAARLKPAAVLRDE